MALDVSAGFGQQGVQDGSGRFLVQAMFGGSGARTKRFLQERDPDPIGAAHFLQGCRRPRLALHHLGKQGQPDGNHLAFLSQARHGLFQELLLVFARFASAFGEFAEGPPKCRQHFSGVIQVEKID